MPDIDVDFEDGRRDEVIAYVGAQVRPGPRRPDHHLRHDARPGRDPRRRPRARPLATARSTGSPRRSRTSSGSSSTRRSRLAPTLREHGRRRPRRSSGSSTSPGSSRASPATPRPTPPGVVISREPLTELMPLQKATNSDGLMTQYEMHAIEALGLLKFDFLGPVEPDDPAPGGRPRPRQPRHRDRPRHDPARRRDDVRAARLGRDDRHLPARVGGHAPLHPRAPADVGLRPRRDGRPLPARARWTTSRPTSGASTARSR